MYTENKKKNNAKYDKMHIKRINLSMKKEEAEKIKQFIYKGLAIALYMPYNEI